MTRPAAGAMLDCAVANAALLAAGIKLAIVFGIAYCIGRVLDLLVAARDTPGADLRRPDAHRE